METGICLIEANQPIYPLELVRRMRTQRAMLIQTSMQFRFVCEALYHVHAERIVVPLPMANSSDARASGGVVRPSRTLTPTPPPSPALTPPPLPYSSRPSSASGKDEQPQLGAQRKHSSSSSSSSSSSGAATSTSSTSSSTKSSKANVHEDGEEDAASSAGSTSKRVKKK